MPDCSHPSVPLLVTGGLLEGLLGGWGGGFGDDMPDGAFESLEEGFSALPGLDCGGFAGIGIYGVWGVFGATIFISYEQLHPCDPWVRCRTYDNGLPVEEFG